ncbi:MAG TPA: hypothetical protein VNW50_24585 [Streptosporangiaceae bacterium]|nr:hypothetical protein [Streptosporangiaceae bacterium]
MFARRDLLLALSFEAGRSRLLNLLRDGALAGASHAAYEAGIAVVRVGPLGNVPGAGKLVRVSFLDPADRDGQLQVGLRWEATGIAGDLFPVLDGDFTLTPAGAGAARLALAGVYRPPLGWLGARLDEAVLHKIADATFSALLRSVADNLVSLVPARGIAGVREPAALLPRPATEGNAT